MKQSPKNTNLTIRARYMMLVDATGIVLSFFLSNLTRYESFSLSIDMLLSFGVFLLFVGFLRLLIYWRLGLYAHIWQYASVPELVRIFQAGTATALLVFLLNFTLLPYLGKEPHPSYSVFFIDWILNISFLSFSRLGIRILVNWLIRHNKRDVLRVFSRKKWVLITGAGNVGTTVSRLIHDNPEMGYSLVGFIDDDPLKHNRIVSGYPVLGTRKDIAKIVADYKVDEVVVAMPTAPQVVIDDIVEICSTIHVATRVIPSIFSLLSGTLSLDQMRQWRSNDGYRSDGFQKEIVSQPQFKCILVTGGAGFIGANFVRYMLEKYPDYKIIVYDKLTYAGNLDNLRGLKEAYGDHYHFVRGDICNYEEVALALRLYAVDAIVNFAAESHVDRSLMDPDSFLQTNVFGTYTMLEAARQFGIKRFHQVSTDEVYGEVIRGSFSEEDPLETRSPYSASKAGADLLAHAYYVSFGMPVTITRGSNNIGPYQYPEKAVPVFVTNAIDDQPLPIYGDGLYVRDYQYVHDHCSGIDIILHKGELGEIYNLGGGNERTTLELAKGILDHLGKPYSLIRLVEDRPGQDRRYSLNCAKVKALGWEPQWPFETALEKTVQWYVDNEWWWRPIKNGEYKQYYEKQFSKRLERAVELVLKNNEDEG